MSTVASSSEQHLRAPSRVRAPGAPTPRPWRAVGLCAYRGTLTGAIPLGMLTPQTASSPPAPAAMLVALPALGLACGLGVGALALRGRLTSLTALLR